MQTLPETLKYPAIIEAIFEVRFEPILHKDAVFGVIYNQFKEDFPDFTELPILQLPSSIRNNDKTLMYSPHYKSQQGDFVVQTGPNVFSLIHQNQYSGWSNFSEKIYSYFKKLSDAGIIKNYIRMSLRYINFFSDLNILEHSKLKIALENKPFNDEMIDFTTEIAHEKGHNRLKILNKSTVNINKQHKQGSIIDIDTTVSGKHMENFPEALEHAHSEEKKLFFSLLTEDLIKELKPTY